MDLWNLNSIIFQDTIKFPVDLKTTLRETIKRGFKNIISIPAFLNGNKLGVGNTETKASIAAKKIAGFIPTQL